MDLGKYIVEHPIEVIGFLFSTMIGIVSFICSYVLAVERNRAKQEAQDNEIANLKTEIKELENSVTHMENKSIQAVDDMKAELYKVSNTMAKIEERINLVISLFTGKK